MNSPVRLETIEVHAEGEPGRVITNAGSFVEGTTMEQRFAYCIAELDELRQLILHEPRGYPGLCAVFVLPPTEPGSDFGMVVLEQGGFTPMSGSNTICAVTAAIAADLVPATEPITEVRIDTAVGTVIARARIANGQAVSVTIENVPAFVVELDVALQVPEYGTVPADIVFGGQFFAQVRAADLGVELVPQEAPALARAGALVKLAARRQLSVAHPLHPGIAEINLVMLHSGDRVPGEPARNTVVLTNAPLDQDRPETWTGVLDRSPCGTGTCARMAALHARQQLDIGEEFRHRGVLDTEFVGRLSAVTEVGGQTAVVPQITGRGWVTGRASWTLDPTDPFPAGYRVGDIWPPVAAVGAAEQGAR